MQAWVWSPGFSLSSRAGPLDGTGQVFSLYALVFSLAKQDDNYQIPLVLLLEGPCLDISVNKESLAAIGHSLHTQMLFFVLSHLTHKEHCGGLSRVSLKGLL